MAEVIWTVAALNDLERILEFIELDDESAAKRLAQKVFKTVERLGDFPDSGSRPRKLSGTPYRRVVVGTVIIYHRKEEGSVFIVHVRRGERDFSPEELSGL